MAALDSSLDAFDFFPMGKLESQEVVPLNASSAGSLHASSASLTGADDTLDEHAPTILALHGHHTAALLPTSASGVSGVSEVSAATSAAESQATLENNSKRGSKRARAAETEEVAEEKRQKKLELNRLASRESRKRKKRRLEELQRSVLFLTHENHQLREQNELLRQMCLGRLPPAAATAVNAAIAQQQREQAAVGQPPMGATLTSQQKQQIEQAARKAEEHAAGAGGVHIKPETTDARGAMGAPKVGGLMFDPFVGAA